MIVIRRPEEAEAYLAEGAMACPRCRGTVAKWGYGRGRTVRSVGTATVTVRPQRVRCRDCAATHILLPTALQPRRADTTEVIGTALVHKANGLGFRRIAERMGRAESTVRRWLRRTSDAHLDWMRWQANQRLFQLAPEVIGEIRYAGNPLKHTLTVLAATAYWDRRRCGFTDPPWTLIGIYTQGRLLSPPPGGG
ncbi:helix-turn-helix domain-containing protein [Rhodococcus opacus]|nr:helix-turn-helix domain-containing protein [Rhodococcus opacus]